MNSHHFPRCQSGHILSGSQSGTSSFLHPWFGHPSHTCTSLLNSSLLSPFILFIHDVLSSPRIPLSPCYAFSSPSLFQHYSSLTSPFLFLPTSPFLPSWPAWAYCPARRSYFSLPPYSLFSSRSRSFFSIYFLPLLPPFSSASPLLRPYCLSRCLPKVARPNVAAPFVAITQSGCLPPCQTPLAWCRLWSSAIIVRCYYVPPTILVPPMLMDAVDHLVHSCLLALSLLLQVAFLPSQARYSSLLCLFVVSSLPFHRRGGLSGTSLWHIVRPVLQCSSPPLIYPAWVLSSPYYDPSMIAFPLFSLSHTGLISLWHIVRLVSRFSHLPSSSSLPPPYLFPILLQSSLAPHQASWYFLKSPPS